MKKILVTGGAGFVGSSIAIAIKQYFPEVKVSALDNLHRKGSELNIPRLEKNGIRFIRGDVRNPKDIAESGRIEFLIECSAEPSVLAGKDGNTDFLIQTNLQGAINCAEFCRKNNAGMLFLSTSRVYPIQPLLNCELNETETRFEFSDKQKNRGLSAEGVAETFPMNGARSLYGATKYAAEIILGEYRDAFSLPIIINRCGVISGPWQFGKADQGIATFWTASHFFDKPLQYIGFNGTGKQVRDLLHIDDLTELVMIQLKNPTNFSSEQASFFKKMPPVDKKQKNTQIKRDACFRGIYNVGGGRKISASLLELTEICQRITGRQIQITSNKTTRYADIPVYISDIARIKKVCGWEPKKSVTAIIEDTYQWLLNNPETHSLFKRIL